MASSICRHMWQTLTPEILCQVFLCAIENTPLLTFEPYLFPWHLSHICSAWRDTFISFPEIWTYFVIDFEQNYPASPERLQLSLKMVQLCLERSKGCPIRFMFIGSDSPEWQLSLQVEILRALANHSIRWKHAHFKTDTGHAANLLTLIVAVKDQLPILHSLFFFVCPSPGFKIAPSANFPDLFDNTPQLRHLSLHYYPLRKLDWSSLSTVHLTITEDTIAAPCFITHTSSKLEELFINGTLPDDILPLTFPSLKRLGVQFEAFLESIKTPALEELFILGEHEVSPNDPIADRIASRFIREQGIHLKKIAIYSNWINTTTILLRYVPDTTRHVYLHSWWKDVTPALSSCSAARYLESITYEHRTHYPGLVAMVEHAESWREKSIVAGSKGIGPFENIQQFSIVYMTKFMDSQDESLADFVDRLKKPFEECGVKCSVHQMLGMNWNLMGVSPHFYFNCYYW